MTQPVAVFLFLAGLVIIVAGVYYASVVGIFGGSCVLCLGGYGYIHPEQRD